LVTAARAGYRWRFSSAADALLERYLRADPASRQSTVNEVLTEINGLETAPSGGYVYSEEHGWETRTVHLHRETLADLEEQAGALTARARHEKFVESFEAAIALVNDPDLPAVTRSAGRKSITRSLIACRNQIVESMTGSLEKPFERMRRAKRELDKRRAAAIAIIMNAEIYLPEDHPDWPKGDHVNGQKEVDAAVTEVRDLWNTKSFDFTLPKRLARYTERLAFIETAAREQLQHSFAGEVPAIVVELRHNPGPAVSLQSYASSEAEAHERDFNDNVRRYNAAFRHDDVPDADRRHVIHMSDYREMMGERRCFIDVRLCRATRKHSEECDKAGRIWHDGPDGTPHSRARAEGFEDGVGENVAIGYGNPKDIWDRGWYRASDHHRNAISPSWNCMGYGYHGRVGTQNFATAVAPWDKRL